MRERQRINGIGYELERETRNLRIEDTLGA